jgi:hypothetical protein
MGRGFKHRLFRARLSNAVVVPWRGMGVNGMNRTRTLFKIRRNVVNIMTIGEQGQTATDTNVGMVQHPRSCVISVLYGAYKLGDGGRTPM